MYLRIPFAQCGLKPLSLLRALNQRAKDIKGCTCGTTLGSGFDFLASFSLTILGAGSVAAAGANLISTLQGITHPSVGPDGSPVEN